MAIRMGVLTSVSRDLDVFSLLRLLWHAIQCIFWVTSQKQQWGGRNVEFGVAVSSIGLHSFFCSLALCARVFFYFYFVAHFLAAVGFRAVVWHVRILSINHHCIARCKADKLNVTTVHLFSAASGRTTLQTPERTDRNEYDEHIQRLIGFHAHLISEPR